MYDASGFPRPVLPRHPVNPHLGGPCVTHRGGPGHTRSGSLSDATFGPSPIRGEREFSKKKKNILPLATKKGRPEALEKGRKARGEPYPRTLREYGWTGGGGGDTARRMHPLNPPKQADELKGVKRAMSRNIRDRNGPGCHMGRYDGRGGGAGRRTIPGPPWANRPATPHKSPPTAVARSPGTALPAASPRPSTARPTAPRYGTPRAKEKAGIAPRPLAVVSAGLTAQAQGPPWPASRLVRPAPSSRPRRTYRSALGSSPQPRRASRPVHHLPAR